MKVKILGSLQDAGAPHPGCECEFCEKERSETPPEAKISSLLIYEEGESFRYLIEATPDIRRQINSEVVDGVFVPHARLGTLGGIEFLGEEGMDAEHLTVYCNKDVKHHLMNNDPYRRLIDRGNIQIEELGDQEEENLIFGDIEAISLDHPHLGHRTTAYRIKGEDKRLFYLPDINEWNEKILREIEKADIAVIDGTFWDESEIDRFDEIPHPTISNSIQRFSDYDTEFYFTHMNHTNPVLNEDSEERNELEKEGFNLAEEGLEIRL